MITPTDPPADQPAPRLRRRWWRRALSLRGLMVLVLLVGGGLGWWVRHVRLRRAAIATIEAAGGVIAFQDQYPPVEGWWAWLYERTGIEEFREVSAITIQFDPTRPRLSREGEPMTPAQSIDATIGAMTHLGPIGYVAFYGFPITSGGMGRLAEVRLTNLVLYKVSAFPEDTLDALSRLHQLEGLDIAMESVILPRGIFGAVGKLSRLKSLSLRQKSAGIVDRAELASLGRLQGLEMLQLSWATLDGDSLDVLNSLDQLRFLSLGSARPDDAALRRLVTHHPRLEDLSVDGSELSDHGVAALADLPELNMLWLAGNQGRPGHLTDASLEALGRTTLGTLGVTCGNFTAVGLDALVGLPLDALELSSIGLGNEAGIGRLVAGRTFRSLSLSGPGVTDAALPHLTGRSFMAGASSLSLSRSAITDAGMPHLALLPLRRLNLDETALTDVGLATLAAGMTARELIARGTRITPAGIAAFEAARPGQGRFDGSPEDE